MADGPADNVPTSVRRIPKPGITVAPEVRKELEDGLAKLKSAIETFQKPPHEGPVEGRAADLWIYHKAVSDALKYEEFFSPQEINKARELLALGNDRLKRPHQQGGHLDETRW